MKNKIYIMKGLPASGKTTIAQKMVDDACGKVVRVNKDDLRSMLHNGKWSSEREKLIIKMRDIVIGLALLEGKDVVVDDTNLCPKHEESIRCKFDREAEIEIIDFTDVSPKECVERDLRRGEKVGKKVIYDMYYKYIHRDDPRKQDDTLRPAIIVDIDGTLAKNVGRSPYDYTRVGEDEVYEDIKNIVNTFNRDHWVILVSGRDESCRGDTEKWLSDADICYSELWMRPAGNTECDTIVKERIYKEKIEGQYYIEFVLDDRQRVVDMWRSLGLRCLQVADHQF